VVAGMNAFWWAQTLLTGGMLAGCSLNALTAPRADSCPKPRRFPKVSLLIPARNEEKNLRILVPALLALEYPHLEVILLDDNSQDDTANILASLPSPIRVLQGLPLPPGWLGKNWACSQLAEKATGELLLFCDADARPEPQAILHTVALFEKYGTGVVSFIPRQFLGSSAEKAVIPVLLHLACCAALPLRLIPIFPWPALGVANGQWLAFRRKAYDQMGGHAAVKDHIVEDLGMARLAQKHRVGLLLALAPKTLTVRMYHDFQEVWNGFGKNLFILAGSSPLQWLPLLAVFLTANLAPWLTCLYGGLQLFRTETPFLGGEALWYGLPLALLLGARLITKVILREPWSAIPLHPWGAILVPLIVARSAWGRRQGTLVWKGRNLALGSMTPKETYP
jgi:chlorobactene glucosyltransferase